MRLLCRPHPKRRLPLVLLAVAALLLPAGVALSGSTYAGVDLGSSYFPHADVIRREALETGTLPLWDFNEFGGAPFLGNLVDGLFYPPNVLFLLLPAGRAFEILVALHLLLSAFGMYRLTRSYRLPRMACALAGCSFALSLGVMARLGAGHYGALVTLSQAPLLLGLIREVVSAPTLRRSLVLALFAAAVPLAGHPPFVYQLALLSAVFAVAELAAIRRERSRAIRAFAGLAGAGLLAVLIGAVHVLPSLEVRRHASRSTLAAGDLAEEQNPDVSWLPRDFSTFCIPLYPRKDLLPEGKWALYFWHEKAVYAGVLPLLCAVFALLGPGRRGPVLFFAGVAVLSVAEAMSRHLPLHRIATTLLPGYQAFRVPARGVWICGMVICILAAFGLARWQTAPAPLKKRFLAIMAVVAILMSIALVVRFGVHPELALFAVLAAGGAAILGLMRDAHGMAIATVGFTILDLGGQALSLVPRAPSGTRTPAPWYLSQLGADPSAFRVLDAGSDWTGYAAASYGIRQLDGAGYPILSRTREFYAPAWEPPPEARMDTLGVGKVVVDPERLDALNVGWLVWVGPSPESGLVEVARHGDSVLYRRPTVRPYATAGTNAVEAGRRGNSILARVALDGPERLVVSESWMPGWRVEVDGRAGSVVAHRGVLLGVELSAGGHDVRFTYLPATFRPGLAISLTALLGTLGFLLRCWMRDRRQAGVSPAAIGI